MEAQFLKNVLQTCSFLYVEDTVNVRKTAAFGNKTFHNLNIYFTGERLTILKLF